MSELKTTLRKLLTDFTKNPFKAAKKLAPNAKSEKEALQTWGKMLMQGLETNVMVGGLKTVVDVNYSRLMEEFAPELTENRRMELAAMYAAMIDNDIEDGGNILSEVVSDFIKCRNDTPKGNVYPFGHKMKESAPEDWPKVLAAEWLNTKADKSASEHIQ